MRLLLAVALAALITLPSVAQRSRPAPRPAQRELTIRNQGAVDIHELYASPTTDDQWGRDRLGDRILPAGSSFAVRFAAGAGCTVDVRVVYADGRDDEVRNHDICREPTLALLGPPTAKGGETRTLALTNRHTRTVFQVFASGDNDRDWGDDLLGSETLDPGDTVSIAVGGGCTVRLRIVFDNDAAEERGDIDVCSSQTLTVGPGWTTADDLAAFGGGAQPAMGAGDAFTLVNNSGRGIFALYVFPDGSADTGPDRLGADMVADGERFEVRLDRGGQCHFTVRVVYEDATPDLDLAGTDLCATQEVVVGPTHAPVAGTGAAGMAAQIRNGGNIPIVELYVAAPGAPRGADRLGAGIIAVGASLEMHPPVDGQCDYQVTGVFRDGREVAVGANLCAGGEVVLQ